MRQIPQISRNLKGSEVQSLRDWAKEAEQQIKELKEEVRELTNIYIKEVENGSHSREKLAELKLSIEPTETIIRGFANLFDGYVKNKHVEQRIKEPKEVISIKEKQADKALFPYIKLQQQINELKKHVSHDIDCRVHDETGGICNCEVNGCDDY